MKVQDNNMIFTDDDEFYEFVVVPELTIHRSDITGHLYSDFELSTVYYDAIEKHKNFMIENSRSIYKHQAVSYRTITKPIKNLVEYEYR